MIRDPEQIAYGMPPPFTYEHDDYRVRGKDMRRRCFISQHTEPIAGKINVDSIYLHPRVEGAGTPFHHRLSRDNSLSVCTMGGATHYPKFSDSVWSTVHQSTGIQELKHDWTEPDVSEYTRSGYGGYYSMWQKVEMRMNTALWYINNDKLLMRIQGCGTISGEDQPQNIINQSWSSSAFSYGHEDHEVNERFREAPTGWKSGGCWSDHRRWRMVMISIPEDKYGEIDRKRMNKYMAYANSLSVVYDLGFAIQYLSEDFSDAVVNFTENLGTTSASHPHYVTPTIGYKGGSAVRGIKTSGVTYKPEIWGLEDKTLMPHKVVNLNLMIKDHAILGKHIAFWVAPRMVHPNNQVTNDHEPKAHTYWWSENLYNWWKAARGIVLCNHGNSIYDGIIDPTSKHPSGIVKRLKQYPGELPAWLNVPTSVDRELCESKLIITRKGV